ncbi:MAG: DNA polymerase III subunit delta' [Desulfobacteraceae bacterium]|jgi:DNA polymerase-3 subunit delta'
MEPQTETGLPETFKPFSAVMGQERAIQYLKRVLTENKVPHAFLFSGISGIGKTTTALAFAQALNCMRPSGGEACGHCVPCRQMAGGNFPDLEILRPDGRVIKIEQVRELIRRIGLKTVSGRYRVTVVERAEGMTTEAANAFLKTLEEPPPGNVLILNVAEKRDLLPTVLSRCQKVPFRPLPADGIAAWLQREKGLPEDAATVVARLSEGSLGRAVRMAEGDLEGLRETHVQDLLSLFKQPPTEILAMALRYTREEKRASRAGGEREAGLYGVLGLWKACFRDMLLLRSQDSSGLLIHGEHAEALQNAAEPYTISDLVESLLVLDRAQRDLLRARNLDLVMETTLLGLNEISRKHENRLIRA